MLRNQAVAGVCGSRRVAAHPGIEYQRLIVLLCLSISLPLQILKFGFLIFAFCLFSACLFWNFWIAFPLRFRVNIIRQHIYRDWKRIHLPAIQ
jgi:hypothetical protein